MITTEFIEFLFYNQEAISKAVYEKRQDAGAGHTGGGGSGHSFISDPTAIAAIKNTLEIKKVVVEYGPACGSKRIRNTRVIPHPEKWLKVVGAVQDMFAKKRQGELYDRRYKMSEDCEKTCKSMSISRGKYYAMQKDIIHAAELYAVGLGLWSPWEAKK